MLELEVIEIGLERPDLTIQSVDLLLQAGPISIFGLQRLSKMQNLRRLISSGLQRQLAFAQRMSGVDVLALHQIVPTLGEGDKRSGRFVQRVDMFLQAISPRDSLSVRQLKHVNRIRLAGEDDLPIPQIGDSSQSGPNVFRRHSRRINCGVHCRDDRAKRFSSEQCVYHRRIEEDR